MGIKTCTALSFALLFALYGCSPDNADVVVSVKKKQAVMVSDFEIGLTHVHTHWELGHPEAAQRVNKLLGEAIRYHNQHITHWGVDENLMPGPGEYAWDSLDYRMNLIRSIDNAIPVITFCGAPAWMKEYNPRQRWQVEIAVRDANVPDFAALCKEVALRYPDVNHFQVWNEFKGYWIKDGKDVKRLTAMYNAVYDSVRKARPEVKIGGPYIPLGDPENDVKEADIEVVNYWMANSRGADFFTWDGWLEGWPPGSRTEEWMMERTDYYGRVSGLFRQMSKMPVWISEFYGGRIGGNNRQLDEEKLKYNRQFTAANHASAYLHSLMNGVRMALLWDGMGLGGLFTRTDSVDGGMPTPHYEVVKAFNQYFGPGTQICLSESSSESVEVLASPAKTMLINKTPESLSVRVNRTIVMLDGYEVKVMDTK